VDQIWGRPQDDYDADVCDFIPIAVLPADGAADTSRAPALVIDYDIDPEICGDHHKTRWQISERPDFYGLAYNKDTIRKDPFSHEVAPGDTVQITIHFEEEAQNNTVFHKYDPLEGWIDYSDHAAFASDIWTGL